MSVTSKPFEQITAEDIRGLVTQEYPESDTVEFKEALPTKDGAPDPWVRGENRISDPARNKILAEVVAFANAGGGHVFLGIAESDDHPKRAADLRPLPQCAALADKLLLQARDCIEPMLPILSARGVATEPDGSGIVVIRVPPSRLAPHRCVPTKECYIRHADRTQTMTMREIRDLVIQRDRGEAKLEQQFQERQTGFQRYINTIWDKNGRRTTIGIRATLLPVSADFRVERVDRNPAVSPVYQNFQLTYGGLQVQLDLPSGWNNSRPIFGGVRYHGGFDNFPVVMEIHKNGLVELTAGYVESASEMQGGRSMPIYPQWVLAVAINAMLTAHRFRGAAGAPDSEYALEMEAVVLGANAMVAKFVHTFPSDVFGPLEPNPLRFFRLSVGRPDEFDGVLKLIAADLFNAAGAHFEDLPLTVQLPENLI
jgi:hypothetical protein